MVVFSFFNIRNKFKLAPVGVYQIKKNISTQMKSKKWILQFVIYHLSSQEKKHLQIWNDQTNNTK